MKEFDVRIRIKNNRLVERREKLGVSALAFAAMVGVNYVTYIKYENLKSYPLRGKSPGSWTAQAKKIADFYGVQPEELWPNIVRKIKKNEVRKKINAEQAYLLVGEGTARLSENTEDTVIKRELARDINAVLATLTPREEKVLRCLYKEDLTLQEVGEKMGVSPGRIRQIEQKALRRLRHSSKSKHLKSYIEY